ncbi:MAG TPA: DUF3137 domain-containing protein, partial [Ferruginibacter sp.]|nr:DUF3137 domain-containing protein [Ferruginibacter sp.]
MEPVEDFESFYTNKIQPFLDQLDQEESSLYNWKRFTIFTGIGIFAFLLLYFIKVFPSGHILAAAMFMMCVIGVYFTAKYNDKYLDDFKDKIIGQIITYIYPSAVYKPMGFISRKEYKASGLYRRRFSHFDGDDYWQTEYDGVSFHCSEIKSWYQDVAGTDYIFKGLFFVASINSSFSGGTYVWTKGKAQLASSLADEHYRLYPLPNVQRVNVNHAAFSKYFTVYTTDPDEASLIFSYHMPDHMLVIREKLDREIVFSFVKGKCYIAVPFDENLLEPSNKGARDKQEIKNYF